MDDEEEHARLEVNCHWFKGFGSEDDEEEEFGNFACVLDAVSTTASGNDNPTTKGENTQAILPPTLKKKAENKKT